MLSTCASNDCSSGGCSTVAGATEAVFSTTFAFAVFTNEKPSSRTKLRCSLEIEPVKPTKVKLNSVSNVFIA